MKYLIVGLGNPGNEYENTRHNIGFKVVESMAKEAGEHFSIGRHAEVAVIKHKGRTLILIKPTTYMNLSGKAVQYYLQSEKIPLENLFVVVDDLALPFGKLRMRPKGSDGGHNGLKDIQATLNTDKYTRLRFGVGSEFNKGSQVNYVLGEWSPEEKEILEERIKVAADFIKSCTAIGTDRAMSLMNNK
jgi:peptidyl-tRNA hydrolase, PTH1 family